MNYFFKKIKNKKSGMTYVELIVVLGIFAVMTSVVLFKYKDFGQQIDLQNLSHDIALQVVTAQKYALSGKLPDPNTPGYDFISANSSSPSGPRPSYGVYFNISTADDSKQFIFFNDFDNSKAYSYTDSGSCGSVDSKCIDKINIENGDRILKLTCDDTDCGNGVSVVFIRPDSSAYITNSDGSTFYKKLEITVSNDETGTLTKTITILSSGRVEVK